MLDSVWILLALIAGLIVRWALHRGRRANDPEVEGISAGDLVIALSTVAILVMAIIVVPVFDSFSNASEASSKEARWVRVRGVRSANAKTVAATANIMNQNSCFGTDG